MASASASIYRSHTFRRCATKKRQDDSAHRKTDATQRRATRRRAKSCPHQKSTRLSQQNKPHGRKKRLNVCIMMTTQRNRRPQCNAQTVTPSTSDTTRRTTDNDDTVGTMPWCSRKEDDTNDEALLLHCTAARTQRQQTRTFCRRFYRSNHRVLHYALWRCSGSSGDVVVDVVACMERLANGLANGMWIVNAQYQSNWGGCEIRIGKSLRLFIPFCLFENGIRRFCKLISYFRNWIP